MFDKIGLQGAKLLLPEVMTYVVRQQRNGEVFSMTNAVRQQRTEGVKGNPIPRTSDGGRLLVEKHT